MACSDAFTRNPPPHINVHRSSGVAHEPQPSLRRTQPFDPLAGHERHYLFKADIAAVSESYAKLKGQSSASTTPSGVLP